ncbi:MAG: NAD(P)/FAD-dependent oxidoreductase [Oscillospiraceae bacterium]|nr:NAD(P)/FAD-dependent oxidoreductase [Oscillospiraceae bacterium]
MSSYKKMFEPIQIGPFTAKNRIEVSPAEPFLCTKEGAITPEFVAYTEAFARGGAGIVYVGDSPINQEYADENHYTVNLADPFITHGLFKVADAIHRYGALAGIELNLRNHVFPADMSVADIKQIIQEFTNAALYSAKAGFDIIMLHGGHGHTIAQFYSPQLNKRTDEYGCGSFENRCRFAMELLDSVRAAVGPNVALDYRISGDDLTPGGVGVEDALRFAKAIESRLDMIHVSAGNMYYLPSMSYTIQNAYLPMATNARFAKRFKEELSIPVTTVGSFNFDLAEQALTDGTADVVAMIRQLIADPEAVNKARRGRGEDIRPCIRCCICTGDDPHGCPKPLRCTVNPVMGRNPEFDVIPPCKPGTKVVVIGGGAAGLEAARRLDQRGAKVVLFEKEDCLGGTLLAAGANSLKVNIKSYAEWSVRTVMENPHIELRLGTEATREAVLAEKPDAVVVAVGSEPFIPPVPGFDKAKVVLASDVDLGKVSVGNKIALIGAGLTGTETAVALAQEGKDVTLIDMLSLDEITARTVGSKSGLMYLRGMSEQAGVKVITGLKAKEVLDDALVALDAENEEVRIPCDTVVLSMGVRPRKELASQFEGTAFDVFYCGDCAVRAGNITSAVRDGFYAAMNID